MAECLRWIPLLLLLLGMPLVSTRRLGSEKLLELRNRRALRRSLSEAMVVNASTADPVMDIDPFMAEIALEKARQVAADKPNEVAFQVRMAIYNSTHDRKSHVKKHTTGNPIDDCWRQDRDWDKNRKKLADCAIGFGRDARGGRDGEIYVVTDPDNDNPENPVEGTLRYGVLQDGPLWITFKRDMVIKLKQELIMTSYKTIDGRGAKVEIAHGACLTLQYITNVIIHGVSIHDCKQTGSAVVRSNSSHVGHRGLTDGDGINIFSSSNIWVDHCTLSKCRDGLVDAVLSSTAITISNNYFSDHDKVMAMGHSDENPKDKIMQVTVAFNHFGEGLMQRMPRGRFGFFHVISNDYTHWLKYALGGSADPTFKSEGNRYVASDDPYKKEITKRMCTPQSASNEWTWTSYDDLYENDAFFTQSGADKPPNCKDSSKDDVECYQISQWIEALTADAGPLSCRVGDWC